MDDPEVKICPPKASLQKEGVNPQGEGNSDGVDNSASQKKSENVFSTPTPVSLLVTSDSASEAENVSLKIFLIGGICLVKLSWGSWDIVLLSSSKHKMIMIV